MVIGAPARRLAKIADANFAIRFAICTSDYTTQHYVSQTSAKTWSQWAAIQERIGLNSGWLPGEQRTALAAPLGLTVRSHLTDNSAAFSRGRGRPTTTFGELEPIRETTTVVRPQLFCREIV